MPILFYCIINYIGRILIIMIWLFFTILFYLGGVVIYALTKNSAEPTLRRTLKMSLSTIYLCLGLYSVITNYSLLCLLLTIGFGFSWLGDLLLRVKFKLGGLCFALFNLLLITHNVTLMSQCFDLSTFTILWSILLIAFISFVICFKIHFNKLGILICIYASLICLTAISGLMLLPTMNLPIILGSVVFTCSDVCLLTDEFFVKKDVLKVANSILYFTAMLLLSITYFIV